MPLYLCNSTKSAIPDSAKPRIAADITRIHCKVTGAPPQFVHAFFVKDDPALDLNGRSALLFGNIRAGRTDAQKTQLIAEMRHSIHIHASLDLDMIGVVTSDVPASWLFEGGEVMPEPGEEAEWLARHHGSSSVE